MSQIQSMFQASCAGVDSVSLGDTTSLKVLPIKQEPLVMESQQEDPEDENEFERIWEGTTWLKPLPYDDMDKDEADEIKKEIKRLESVPGYIDSDDPEEYKATVFDDLKLAGVDFGESGFEAGPVLQMISFSIYNESDSWKEIKIYGHISVRDDENNAFCIYDRKEDNAEVISPCNNSLSLNDCHIAPVRWGNVEFSLTTDSGDQIFAVKSDAEYNIKDVCEGKKVVIGNDGYYALMVFTIIPYASIAKVRMYLHDTNPYTGEDEAFSVHGEIKVKTYDVHGKIQDIVYFEKDPSEPVVMKHGVENYIEQCTNVFAVSVFSPFFLDISLYSGETILAKGVREIDPGYRLRYELSVNCNKNYKVHISAKWFSPSEFFGRKKLVEDGHVKWSLDDRPQIDQPTDHPLVDYKYVDRSPHFPLMDQIDRPPAAGCPLVEIFSVLVGGGDSAPALCGTIVVQHRDETVYIFSRNDNCPDELSSSSNEQQQLRRSLSLAWSDKWWVVEKDFLMHLKLVDVGKRRVCRGALQWSEDCDSKPSRYDRRLCYVIPGENGYFAAVHYSIFTKGLRAKVTVECNKCDCCRNNYGRYNKYGHIIVYGSVFAEYSNYTYPSTYDKEYYRSIIFKRSEEDHVVVKNCSKIPLSKSRVSVPLDCHKLIVDVKLLVESSTCFRHVGRAFGRLPFEAGRNGVCEIRSGEGGNGWGCEDCCIRVKVDWF